jgi:hypothetical protein
MSHRVSLVVVLRRLPVLAVTAAIWLAASAAAGAASPVASSARTVSLGESAHLRLTSHHGFTLNEVGRASGTVRGTLYLHLRIVSTNRVSAEVSIYPSGGSLTGYASASYHVNGGTASFAGTMSIARGTGTYRHAHGSGLAFFGSIRRSDDAVTVYLHGRMYD